MNKNNNVSSFEEEKEKRRRKTAKEGFFTLLDHTDDCALFDPRVAGYAFGSFLKDDFPLCIIGTPQVKKEEKTGRAYKEYSVKVYKHD